MSEGTANLQRRTNTLVRLIGAYVFRAPRVKAEQIYGLCKLTWITKSYEGVSAKYIASTKIPGLASALSRDYTGWSLSDVAEDIASTLESDEAASLVKEQTGFTNFYNAYRNSCRHWLQQNRAPVERILRAAFAMASDEQGLELASAITNLPQIPNANLERGPMKPEYLLTPVLFALDRRLRFPLINGNAGVKALLKKLGAVHSALDEQYTCMIALYGKGGIRDAADLDQCGHDLPDFIDDGRKRATKELLHKRPLEGNLLPIKDEGDIESLQKARTVTHRRLHNTLTNALRDCLAAFTLLEGRNDDALFDVLVKRYDANDDLLIEAKSSADPAHIRMALGQLYDYWFKLKGPVTPHLAVLTPEKPADSTIAMLRWLEVGVLWLENGALKTCSANLKKLCDT